MCVLCGNRFVDLYFKGQALILIHCKRVVKENFLKLRRLVTDIIPAFDNTLTGGELNVQSFLHKSERRIGLLLTPTRTLLGLAEIAERQASLICD
ncbi:MAG: hypothetical protein QXZ09_08875 [Candidatus Methanomethylicaceae archaeon]